MLIVDVNKMNLVKRSRIKDIVHDFKVTARHSLFLEYLCLSASYELARKVRSKERLSAAEERQTPQDFDQVLALYDLLGDVNKLDFPQLLVRCDREVFGDLWARPRVHLMGDVLPNEDIGDGTYERKRKRREHTLRETRRLEGLPPAVLLHVPCSIQIEDALKQVEIILKSYKQFPPRYEPLQVVPKIQFEDVRLQFDALMKGLNLIRTKALNPDIKQWQLGAKFNLSKKHSEKAAMTTGRIPKKQEDEQLHREMLYRITHRALKKAEYTAENAARGRFPVDTKIDDVKFDYAQIRSMTNSRIEGLMDYIKSKYQDDRSHIENFAYIVKPRRKSVQIISTSGTS